MKNPPLISIPFFEMPHTQWRKENMLVKVPSNTLKKLTQIIVIICIYEMYSGMR
jgi:hypothetical protein